MFANFSALRHVCQLRQQMAKYAISIDNLYQKYITRGYVCQFGGPHNVGKHTFWGKCLVLSIFTHRFGHPGPLQPPFELPTSIFQPDAATKTLHALNWLQSPKTSKCFSDLLQHFKYKSCKSEGLNEKIDNKYMAVRVLLISRNHYQMLTMVHFYHGRMAGAWWAHGIHHSNIKK